jgi:hypothetical protein
MTPTAPWLAPPATRGSRRRRLPGERRTAGRPVVSGWSRFSEKPVGRWAHPLPRLPQRPRPAAAGADAGHRLPASSRDRADASSAVVSCPNVTSGWACVAWSSTCGRARWRSIGFRRSVCGAAVMDGQRNTTSFPTEPDARLWEVEKRAVAGPAPMCRVGDAPPTLRAGWRLPSMTCWTE